MNRATTAKTRQFSFAQLNLEECSHVLLRLGRSLQVFSPSRTLQRCPKRVTIIMSAPANTWQLCCEHRISRQCIHKHVSRTLQQSSTSQVFLAVRLGRSLQVFSPSRTLQRCPKRVTIIMSAPEDTWPLWCGHRNLRQCIHKHVSIMPKHSRTNKETTHKHDRDHVFLAVRLGRSLQLFSSSRTLRRCPKRVTVITPTFPT